MLPQSSTSNNKDDKIWTLLELVRWGENYFRDKGIESPRLNIESMLCKVLNISRVDIYLLYDRPLSRSELDNIKIMIKRRVAREPLQYILGECYFAGSRFILNDSVLIPRPETELLVNLASDYINKNESITSVLDIGTGSGCIAVSLAKRFPHIQVSGIDISQESLVIAQENADLNEVENIEFSLINILKEVPTGRFDLIVSNPPYISKNDFETLQPELKLHEPPVALTDGDDGLTFYREFSEIFPDLLNAGGNAFVEIGFGQKEQILDVFSKEVYKTSFYNDFSDIPRVLEVSI
jgi:release factor glutamine methyltransferase